MDCEGALSRDSVRSPKRSLEMAERSELMDSISAIKIYFLSLSVQV